MIKYEIDVKIDEEKIKRAINIGIDRFCDSVVTDAKFSLDAHNTTYEGHLKDATTYSQISDSEWQIIADIPYASYIEFGSGPRSSVSVAQLKEWVQKKKEPGIDDESAITIANNIAKSLKERGNKPQPFMRPALDRNFPEIAEQLIASAISE
jgi:hypothetical protein